MDAGEGAAHNSGKAASAAGAIGSGLEVFLNKPMAQHAAAAGASIRRRHRSLVGGDVDAFSRGTGHRSQQRKAHV
ncbi:hypothetical protein HXX76_002091 [Chlamydomonas incerta]|uniref:Uncharacterized protein n=1 Tax=Chlamydomonas incerta TaxID=51695 RepID=A0A835WAF8_CHLIN|nr:hypothetical protein HXX76_002091 [Chlamydomonas incerta]|eukprot:KAG2443745.1 hypothetical protein HXX76_002091 [Chlamydomonas incerta]